MAMVGGWWCSRTLVGSLSEIDRLGVAVPLDTERAGAVTPRTPRWVACFTSFRLLELEVSGYRGSVRCGHRQVIASVDLLGRLPVVDELTSSRIVAEARAARSHHLDRIFRVTVKGQAINRLGHYRGDGTGAGQLGGAREELELHRHGRAVLDGIQDVAHVNRLVEALEVPGADDQGASCLTLVVVVGDLSQDVVAANVGRVSNRVATLAVGDVHVQARRSCRGRSSLGRAVVGVGSEVAQRNCGRGLV